MSFRDAILQNSTPTPSPIVIIKPNTHKRRKIAPQLVVVQPQRTRRERSTMEDDQQEQLVLGETDAPEYYSRKEHGACQHGNGLKIRPDEAKRLQITMNKKQLQRQRQQQSRRGLR